MSMHAEGVYRARSEIGVRDCSAVRLTAVCVPGVEKHPGVIVLGVWGFGEKRKL